MRSHDVLCHSVIERVILSASNSLDHYTQVVKFQEDSYTLLLFFNYVVTYVTCFHNSFDVSFYI